MLADNLQHRPVRVAFAVAAIVGGGAMAAYFWSRHYKEEYLVAVLVGLAGVFALTYFALAPKGVQKGVQK